MKCPSTAELYERPELAESPHVLNCPRCGARLRALAEFLRLAEEPAQASLGEVESELRRRLAHDIRSAGQGGVPRHPRLNPPRRARSLVFASTAVAALVLFFWWTPLDHPEIGTLRSGSDAEDPRLILGEDSSWSGSVLELEWSAVPEARNYQVVVYDSQLRELLSQDIAGAERWGSPLEAPGSAAVWVRVRALGKAGLIMESDLVALSPR